MKQAVAVALVMVTVAVACNQKHGDEGESEVGSRGSGSAAPPGELVCADAARQFTAVVAASPGELADLKANAAEAQFVKTTVEESCDTAWSPEIRTCVLAATAASALPACWKEDSAGYAAAVKAVHDVVQTITSKRTAAR